MHILFVASRQSSSANSEDNHACHVSKRSAGCKVSRPISSLSLQGQQRRKVSRPARSIDLRGQSSKVSRPARSADRKISRHARAAGTQGQQAARSAGFQGQQADNVGGVFLAIMHRLHPRKSSIRVPAFMLVCNEYTMLDDACSIYMS